MSHVLMWFINKMKIYYFIHKYYFINIPTSVRYTPNHNQTISTILNVLISYTFLKYFQKLFETLDNSKMNLCSVVIYHHEKRMFHIFHVRSFSKHNFI